jgi:hypothetical protein
MPVPPAELTAHFTVEGPDGAFEAAREAAAPSGIVLDAGPGELALSGARAVVISALEETIAAALDAGASKLDVRLEAPAESRR